MAKVSSIIALEDKMTPTLNKIEREAVNQIKTFEKYSESVDNVKKSLAAVEKSNPKIVKSEVYAQASQALEKMEAKLYDVANGNDKFNQSLDDTQSKVSGLSTALASLIGWGAIIKGTKSMIELSDVTTQTNARLGLMTDNVQGLSDTIFSAAQRSRVGYQAMADVVSKLGMQAGEAFNNSNEQIVYFSELLNKLFTTSGLDSTAIESTMYNLTQSLSTGKLLGQDYRILKQNAPQILQYLRQFYGETEAISQASLDEMVSKGQVTAQDLKNALFKASTDINNKFEKMPITFGQAWTRFKNSFIKAMQPVTNILSNVANWLSNIFSYLSEHQYILYTVLGAIGAISIALLTHNTILAITAALTDAATLATLKFHLALFAIVAVVATVVGVLIHLWNTNDEVATAMMTAWDGLQIGMKTVALGIKIAFYGLATAVETIAVTILMSIQNLVNGALAMINGAINAANNIPGVNLNTLEYKTFGDKAADKLYNRIQDRNKAIASDTQDLIDLTAQLNATRDDRVANRKKIGMGSGAGADIGSSISNALSDFSDEVVGTDAGGGKAVKTTTDDQLISDEDIQLLLDVATRDYKLNYQQVTPNITLTFGDIRETVDVDDVLDQVADRLEEIYDGNLEVE